MSMQQTQKHCPTCNEMRLFQRNGTNHVLHLIITIVLVVCTCGTIGFLWIPVWILCAIFKEPYRCTKCGFAVKESHSLLWILLLASLFVCGVGVMGFVKMIKDKTDSWKQKAEESIERKKAENASKTNEVKIDESSVTNIPVYTNLPLNTEKIEDAIKNETNIVSEIIKEPIKTNENKISTNSALSKMSDAILQQRINRKADSILRLIDGTSGDLKEELSLEMAVIQARYEKEHGKGSFGKTEDFITLTDELIRKAASGKIRGDKQRIEELRKELKELSAENNK